MKNEFNIFRLNCIKTSTVNDTFTSVITSVICNIFYNRKNEQWSLKELYHCINDELHINIDYDILSSVISNSAYFKIETLEDDILICITSEKYEDIDSTVLTNSIEYHIKKFATSRNVSEEDANAILLLLSKSIYENINSFSTNNLSSILSSSIEELFTKEQIQLFNDFLDDKDHFKNIALYNTFLKAIEFAIVTSGKGVKSLVENIFRGKQYILDTNVLFRLIGIGGNERKESIRKLIQMCNHHGIVFTYSPLTIKELNGKIDDAISNLKTAVKKDAIEIIENLYGTDKNSPKLNNSFFSLYSKLKIQKRIHNVTDFEAYLKKELRSISKEFNIEVLNPPKEIKQRDVDLLKNELYTGKRQYYKYSTYTHSAAEVDSANINYVKYIRGGNNYNYSDVRSFYLTTDKSLNKIMASKATNNICETILPSQLFLIHSALYDSELEHTDFECFNKFIKKRTLELQYTGKQVLKFIDEIREVTTNKTDIENIILTYCDMQYNSKDSAPESDLLSIKDLAQTYMDTKLGVSEAGNIQYKKILLSAFDDLKIKDKIALQITRIIDILLIVLIIPLLSLSLKNFFNGFILSFVILALEIIKFVISNKTNFMRYIRTKVYLLLTDHSAYSSVLKEEAYNAYSEKRHETIYSFEKNVWK